jgi:hypothetical protein
MVTSCEGRQPVFHGVMLDSGSPRVWPVGLEGETVKLMGTWTASGRPCGGRR